MSKRFFLLLALGFTVNAILEYQFVSLVRPFVEIQQLMAVLFISLVDTLFLIFVYWALSLDKITKLSGLKIYSITSISVVTVITAEWIATNLKIWEYKSEVLTLPYIDTILVAFIHYLIVPAAIFYIVTKLTKPV